MKKKIAILFIVTMLIPSACAQKAQDPAAGELQLEESIGTQDAERLSPDEAPYMQLKTADYRAQSIKDFDEAFAPYQDDFTGYGKDDPESEFKRTLLYAKMQLLYDGNGETPLLSLSTATEAGQLAFDILWTIADKDVVTVGQRDELINLAEELVAAAANELGADSGDVLSDLQAAANEIASGLTADWVTVEIVIESMDNE